MSQLGYPDAIKRFYERRNIVIDEIGYLPVGACLEVAQLTATKTRKTAAWVASTNKLLDYGTAMAIPAVGAIKSAIDASLLSPEVERILSDLEDIERRIETIYTPALQGKNPLDPMPDEVRPLMFNVAGSRYTRPNGTTVAFVSPDALGWVLALDEYDQLLVVRAGLVGEFVRQFEATATEYTRAVTEAGLAVVEGANRYGGLIAAAVLTGLGIYAYRTFGKGNQ